MAFFKHSVVGRLHLPAHVRVTEKDAESSFFFSFTEVRKPTYSSGHTEPMYWLCMPRGSQKKTCLAWSSHHLLSDISAGNKSYRPCNSY